MHGKIFSMKKIYIYLFFTVFFANSLLAETYYCTEEFGVGIATIKNETRTVDGGIGDDLTITFNYDHTSLRIIESRNPKVEPFHQYECFSETDEKLCVSEKRDHLFLFRADTNRYESAFLEGVFAGSDYGGILLKNGISYVAAGNCKTYPPR
tara:strand:- start:121 stop:576 length:456 start_codon:yes stop_codon:yes gene_type:complete